MNVEQINQGLIDLANSGDPYFAQAAAHVGGLVLQAQNGELTADEVVELLRDVQRQINVIQQMSQLEFKEKLNVLINGLIALAGVVP
jgi:hypothetical protein